MSDKGPNYSVERQRLEFTKAEHEQTIAKGDSRIGDIERQKKLNIMRTDLANAELDDEVRVIKANESALRRTMGEIDKKIELMVAPKESDNG